MESRGATKTRSSPITRGHSSSRYTPRVCAWDLLENRSVYLSSHRPGTASSARGGYAHPRRFSNTADARRGMRLRQRVPASTTQLSPSASRTAASALNGIGPPRVRFEISTAHVRRLWRGRRLQDGCRVGLPQATMTRDSVLAATGRHEVCPPCLQVQALARHARCRSKSHLLDTVHRNRPDYSRPHLPDRDPSSSPPEGLLHPLPSAESVMASNSQQVTYLHRYCKRVSVPIYMLENGYMRACTLLRIVYRPISSSKWKSTSSMARSPPTPTVCRSWGGDAPLRRPHLPPVEPTRIL